MVLDPEKFQILVDEMEAFLRVPKVTWDEWTELDIDTKAALLVAAKRIFLEQALLLSQGVSGPMGALALSRNLDGGEAWVTYHLEAAITEYMAREREKRLEGMRG